VLPAEWGEVLQQFGSDLAVPNRGIDRSLNIDRVPEHDGCCDQGKAAGTIALLLEAAIPYLSESAEEGVWQRFGTKWAIWGRFEPWNTPVNGDRLAQALLEKFCGSDLRDENEQIIAIDRALPAWI
jgi:hypothetical protein